jgi:hypothetical protein
MKLGNDDGSYCATFFEQAPHLGFLEVKWRSWLGGHGTFTTDKVPHVVRIVFRAPGF